MKSSNVINKIISLGLLVCLACSCKKAWLDAKPEKALRVPNSIRDFQALLDNTISSAPSFNSAIGLNGEMGAGDFFVADVDFATLTQSEKNLYTWEPDIYKNSDQFSGEWNNCYQRIFYTNAILEGIEKITPGNNPEQIDWNQVKGSALVFRALNHFIIAQDFCKSYDKSTAGSDMGIPIRIVSDPNVVSTRASVEATYGQIISDLKLAFSILPVTIPSNTLYKLRPTKTAATAMLARVYLSMGAYDSAYVYANKTLQQYNTLLDYNLSPPMLPISNFFQVPKFNSEVILHLEGAGEQIFGIVTKLAGSVFVNSYNLNDLRTTVFWYQFGSDYVFVGNYNNSDDPLFCGLSTDEMYLIRAECLARTGNRDAALADLNLLIQKRWNNSVPYPTITATTANEALAKILNERRKELIYRGVRWSDLRRLNKDPQFAVTLTRTVNGTTYTLPPNSPLYVLPIPPDVIALTGMPQNPR